MGLPRTPVPIDFKTQDGTTKREVVVRRETGYAPTPEYHPSMRLGKCSRCKQVGTVEFKGGMNIKEGDRIMDGKPIWGDCYFCGKKTEFVPLPVDDPRQKGLKLYYDMQRALDHEVRNGRPLPASGDLFPLARRQRHEEWRKRAGR
jgi:hypothetical protein